MKFPAVAALILLASSASLAMAQSGGTSDPLAPDQARGQIGNNVVVEGTAHVRDDGARLGVYIELGNHPGGTSFAGYIPQENLRVFPDLRRIDGRQVDIMGVVQIRKEGFPIIIMTTANQLRPADYRSRDRDHDRDR
jgi:hypothetical protein